jgi:hypothetical protein
METKKKKKKNEPKNCVEYTHTQLEKLDNLTGLSYLNSVRACVLSINK